MIARFFRRLVARFVLVLFNFIWVWGFGGIRNNTPINRFVLAIVVWSSRIMSDTDRIRAEIAANEATLHFHRALAINAYAEVEQSLCRLLAAILNVDWQAAAVIFYNVQNTHARGRIFDELLEKRHGEKYRDYWTGTPGSHPRRGMSDLIRQLDQARNEIVHWHIGSKMSEDERGHRALQKPRAVQLIEADMKSLSIPELTEFIQKADFISRSLTLFANFAGTDEINYDKNDPAGWRVEAWLEIFRTPPLYPPSDTHPLSPNYKEPENPPSTISGVISN